MLSQNQQNEAMRIARFVAENGRVRSKGGKFVKASMEAEVSFEAGERGHDARTAQEMGRYAARNSI